MATSPKAPAKLPSLPVTQAVFKRLMATFELSKSEQQRRIVELILRGCKDKQIAEIMGIAEPTVRTYLGRIFARVGVRDRMGLVLRLFAESQEI